MSIEKIFGSSHQLSPLVWLVVAPDDQRRGVLLWEEAALHPQAPEAHSVCSSFNVMGIQRLFEGAAKIEPAYKISLSLIHI